MNKNVPSWGKVIGILMICLGSLGVFNQFYKMMIRTYANIGNGFGGGNFGGGLFGNMFRISETQGNIMMLLGVLGLAACVFYIIAGAKLLKAEPANYNFAKYALFGFIGFNVVCITWMAFNSNSFLIMGMMTYVGFGLALDVAMLIIFMMSDSSGYGVGEPRSDSAILDGTADEFDFE
jgi:hypothetical protein